MIEVIVLGSSGSYATPTNPCTGYLVRTPDAAVLLDCGPGTLGPLQQATKLEDITAVILTHCHPDHWLELRYCATCSGTFVAATMWLSTEPPKPGPWTMHSVLVRAGPPTPSTGT